METADASRQKQIAFLCHIRQALPYQGVWPPPAPLFGHQAPTRLARSGRQRGGSTIDPPIGLHPIRPSSASARTPLSSPATTLPRSSHRPRCGHRVRLMGPSASKHTLSATHVRRTASAIPSTSSALTRGQAACPNARGTAATLCQRCRAPLPEARPVRDRLE